MEQNKDKDKKLYLLMGILVIVILFVLRSLITSQNYAIVDYDEIISGMTIVSKGTITKDREVYYIVEDILTNMHNAYSSSDKNEIEKYYEVLNKSYKNKISISKFLELIDGFFNNMVDIIIDTDGELEVAETKNVIRSIYMIDTDTYICIIGSQTSQTFGYIGLTLNTYNSTFEIFYLE